MGRTDAKETKEMPLERLGREAWRVAGGMAALRRELLERLYGPYEAFANRRDSGNDPLRPSKGAATPGFSPFYYYPFLFASAFPSVRIEDLRSLAMANRILLEAILLSDRKIDEERPWGPTDFYLIDIYFHKALEMLLPLFPLDHEFWRKTQGWFLQHARAVTREQRRHHCRLCRYTREEFFEISTGKVALIKTTLLAMSLLSENPSPRAALMESQDRFLTGFQCFDDLRDWKQDLRHKNFSFLLTRVLMEGGFSSLLRRGDPLPQEEVGRILYHQGIAEEQLLLAEQYFQGAIDSVKNVHVPDWTNMVREFLRHCNIMRHDLKEIRRRTARKGTPKRIEACLTEAVDFILRSKQPLGGFSLDQSPCPYMVPSTSRASSRFVTFCLAAALAPLQGMDSRLSLLLDGASQWLDRSQKRPVDSSLPAPLEESFASFNSTEQALVALDKTLGGARSLSPHGLFWANLFFAASRQKVRLPELESLVRDSIREANYALWTHSLRSESSDPSQARGVSHPLVPLLLFCCASGPDLPRRPLHEYLLRRCRATGGWNNPTEAALSLLCLLSTGYRGPELSLAAEKLLRTQEADGSWPPNSLYEQAHRFYGSRALTTAWCLLALYVYHLGPGLPAGRRKGIEPSGRQVPNPTIVVHAGLPDRLHGFTLSVMDRLRMVLSPPWPHTLFLGVWPAMPPHFLLKTGERIVAGINIDRRGEGPFLSTGRRPLTVEVVMAVMSAHRCLRTGPLRDRLERLFVAGAALHWCAGIWPRLAPWERLGMMKLDWDWCREHEPFLWEELRRFLLHPAPRQPVFRWLLPDCPTPTGSPVPRGACLFLGESLFSDPSDDQKTRLQVDDLLGRRMTDILRAFRRKVGLDSSENSFM